MKFQTQTTAHYSLVTLQVEKLDSIVAPELKALFVALTTQHPDKSILVDVSSVTFCDSSGLSALLLAYRLCRDAGTTCIFAGAQPKVIELLEISQLKSVLNLVDAVEDGIQTLTASLS
jgi:anti-sigma B factor antagonist